ncbi:MAG: antibiotic biosynthesis monooxygenase [Chloroflexota bacterium]
MILEVAKLQIRDGQTAEFETAFARAQSIIAAMPGYISHQLHRSIETPDQYLLLVEWETLEDHTEGFRQSPQYQEWKRLLHHFYDPFPTVEHYVPTELTNVGAARVRID